MIAQVASIDAANNIDRGDSQHLARLVAHALRADGYDASEDGTGRGTPLIAFDTYNQTVSGDATQTLCSRGDTPGGNAHLVPAIAFDARQSDVIQYGDRTGPLDTDGSSIAVAFDITGTGPGMINGAAETDVHTVLRSRAPGGSEGSTTTVVAVHCIDQGGNFGMQGGGISTNFAPPLGTNRAHAINTNWAVRRLTPTECERLQGFPDGYTAVPYRGRPAADGPRYKALGNSMAVNVMRWIGRRIEMVAGM